MSAEQPYLKSIFLDFRLEPCSPLAQKNLELTKENQKLQFELEHFKRSIQELISMVTSTTEILDSQNLLHNKEILAMAEEIQALTKSNDLLKKERDELEARDTILFQQKEKQLGVIKEIMAVFCRKTCGECPGCVQREISKIWLDMGCKPKSGMAEEPCLIND